jgi:arylsulfatase A-like enzyme
MYYAPDSHNHYVPTAIPGHVPPAAVLNDPSLVSASTTMPPGQEDHLTMKLAVHTFQTIHQQVTLINVPEFDWPLGHVYGGDPVKASYLMQGFDRDLGMLERAYAKAGVLDKTLFVVTADHGMAQLKYQIPDQVMDEAVTKAGTTAPETTYSTGGYIWLQNPAVAQTVANTIVADHNAHIQSVYYKTGTKSGDRFVRAGGMDVPPLVDNANQYLLSSFAGGNSPDVVVLCMEDSAFVSKGAETWKGNHGGASWNSQHMPLLISGPGVVRGVTSTAPARLQDIAPTVLTLMGARPGRMDGSVLADALAHATSAQTRTQAKLNGQLSSVVQGLSAQSQGELSAEAASE